MLNISHAFQTYKENRDYSGICLKVNRQQGDESDEIYQFVISPPLLRCCSSEDDYKMTTQYRTGPKKLFFDLLLNATEGRRGGDDTVLARVTSDKDYWDL